MTNDIQIINNEMRFRPSAMRVVTIAISLLFIFSTMTLGYTNAFQATLPYFSMPVILEGATLIDGTGALPRPNTTIVMMEIE